MITIIIIIITTITIITIITTILHRLMITLLYNNSQVAVLNKTLI